MIADYRSAAGVVMGFLTGICASISRADIVEYREKQDWESAVGQFITIGFADLPNGTWVTEQYAHLGVHFVDGWDQVVYGEITFLQDGAGLVGGEQIDIIFDQPIYWIAADFPGYLGFDLYFEGEFIHRSSEFGIGGYGNFGGLVSTVPFDRAVLWEYGTFPNVFVDDLHFGPPIPAPSALCIVSAALLTARRRRT